MRPGVLLHGHVPSLTPAARQRRLQDTVVCNVAGRHLLEIRPARGGTLSEVAEAHGHAR
jgi:hypothetical protein